MDEKDIMQLITSEYSWEQIIYKIIAWEGMNPWNLDLSLLSRSFLAYVGRMKELDFKIPAKYVVIAAVLLRMKSDHIEYLKGLAQPEPEEPLLEDAGDPMADQIPQTANGEINLALASLNVPSRRQPVRKIVASELIAALRNALRTDERRSERSQRRREQIVINEENITERIAMLYKRIDSLLERLKDEEIEFSELVNVKSRDEILSTFVPLIHLDHDKKVHCRQEELFREIYIRKATGEAPTEKEIIPAAKKPAARLKSGEKQKLKHKLKQAKAAKVK
ncbi:MAG TPA: segregation/condensation protein A [archaeon]|nr:segregation/condensation protein A [archaeon]